MENYGTKINVVTFIFMLLFFARETKKYIKTQRTGSYQML